MGAIPQASSAETGSTAVLVAILTILLIGLRFVTEKLKKALKEAGDED